MNARSQPVLPQLPETAVWNNEEIAGPAIDLVAFTRSFVARWPFLLLAVAGGGVLFYLLSFLVRPTFQSAAVFLPPTNRPPISDNPFAALWSAGSNVGALYPGLLKSNSVLDTVIKDLDLQKEFKAKDLDETRAMLLSRTKVSTDTAGFYTVAVRDRVPARAKAMADKYLEALTATNTRLALDQANQQRMVFERELMDAKNKLEEAEADLAKAQISTGVVSAKTQTEAGLSAINELRAQITAKQVDLAALRQAETEQAPMVVKLRSQIGALEAQLQTMEKGAGGGAGAGLSASRAPGVNLEFLRLQREVLYHQSVYEILTKQFESTQLQATGTPGIQVVDYPELPRKKAFPRRKWWALGGAVGAGFVAMMAVFFEDRYRVLREDPERSGEMQTLAQALRRPSWKL